MRGVSGENEYYNYQEFAKIYALIRTNDTLVREKMLAQRTFPFRCGIGRYPNTCDGNDYDGCKRLSRDPLGNGLNH